MIDRMGRWMADEAEGKKIFFYIGLYIPLALIVSLSIAEFFEIVHAPISQQADTVTKLKNLGPLMVWPILFITVAIEEFTFRLAPLFAAFSIFGEKPTPLLISALVASAVFGFLHGNYSNIFVQGASGFLLCLLFLKCGGFNGNIVKAFTTTSVAHFFFNSLLVLSLMVSGKF